MPATYSRYPHHGARIPVCSLCRSTSRRWAQRFLLVMLLLSLEETAQSSGKWDPDMRVPPTPTPPKSAWQRRRPGSDDSSSTDLLNRAALTESEMDDQDTSPSSANSVMRQGSDPMVMDTPLPKASHSRRPTRRVSATRSESRKPRRKGDGAGAGSEPMIRKLHFDSPTDAHSIRRQDSGSQERDPNPALALSSPKSPFPDLGREDDPSQHTPGSNLNTPPPTRAALRSPELRSPDRINAFATSPLSPLPPGSGGVSSMTRRLSHATSFARDFFDVEEVGSGEHGKVFKCVRRMDLWPYAVKVLQRGVAGPKDRERVLQEIYALASQWENPHAVRYFNAWEEKDVVYIQTELCQSTIAQEWAAAAPLPEERVWRTLAQAACGLHHMHQQGVAHLDLKPSNFYVSMSGLIKIGDFGHATEATKGALDGVAAGDRRYVSREVLEGDEEADLCKADMFSLGASILELLGPARLPPSGAAFHAIRDGVMSPPAPDTSPLLFAIIRQLMHPDPTQRPSAQAVLEMPEVAKFLSLRAKSVLSSRSKANEDAGLLQPSLNRALKWGREQEERASHLQEEIEKLKRRLASMEGS